MKTTLSMVALVALLASGCVPSSVAEQANVTTSEKPTTRLYVRTTPAGAKIRIDGKEKPKTSPQLFDVPAGAKSMTVEVELGGHPGQRKVVVIEGGRITRVEFKFDGKPERPPSARVAPQLTRHFVRLVVDKDRMTFQGEDTNWQELPKLLEKIADRRHTVLTIARAPGKITAEQWNEAQGKAVGLVRRFDFQHLSIIGVHPLGSKGEGTRTLSEGKTEPPIEPPAAGIPARSIWDRVMNPPKGWTIEKSLIVPPDQTAAIGKKLGGPIKKLSNTIYLAHGQRVQVNVIECWTNADAEDIHKNVLATKGDPAYALELGDTIVEFVGTFDVAFAKRLARELLAPKRKPASFGPVSEQFLSEPRKAVAELLDLDTRRRATMKEFGRDDRETHRWIREQKVDVMGLVEMGGAGLMLFDVAVWENPSVDWERITAAEVRDHQALAQTEPESVAVIGEEDLSKLPRTYLFRTREGGMGVLQLVGAEGSRFVKIRYKLVQQADSSTAVVWPASGVWSCSMHPDVRLTVEGKCPICGMDLVPASAQPDSEQAVRWVVASFAKAAVEGDKGTMAELLHEKSHHLLEQIADMQEIVAAGMEPAEIDRILIRQPRALAATRLTQLDHRQYPRPVCMVYILERQGGKWVIRDVDVEDKQGLADEIRRLRDKKRDEAGAADGTKTTGQPPVEGVVLSVAGDGLVEISIGADDGLRRGHRLEVYRRSDPDGRPVYVGRIEVVKMAADKSVCRIERKLAKSPVQKGDRVRRRLLRESSSLSQGPLAGSQARREQVRTQIGLLRDTLSLYKLTLRRYPTNAEGLESLWHAPAAEADADHWSGPYFKGPPPVDPWGNPYVYRSPGKYNPDSFDLWSAGPDGIDGTDDDVGNWEPKPGRVLPGSTR